jgi:cytidylate kinase
MTASVVSFSNQVGSGGGAISRAVAEKLKFRYYDWEIISQAAQEAGVSPEVLAVVTAERAPGFIERVLSRLAGVGAVEEPPAGPPGTTPNLLGSEDYRQFIEHVVRELANQGEAVIVNRAGQVLLKELPGVVKVLIYGSLDRRAARFADAQGREPNEVLRMLTESDRQRGEYLKRVYHIEWLNTHNYDLAINTDCINPELAADMIAATAREFP